MGPKITIELSLDPRGDFYEEAVITGEPKLRIHAVTLQMPYMLSRCGLE